LKEKKVVAENENQEYLIKFAALKQHQTAFDQH
jgi:hypothetical protein